MVVKYKIECSWDLHSGWNCSFGTKKLWETKNCYTVADNINGTMKNHEVFNSFRDALDYMRTGKR